MRRSSAMIKSSRFCMISSSRSKIRWRWRRFFNSRILSWSACCSSTVVANLVCSILIRFFEERIHPLHPSSSSHRFPPVPVLKTGHKARPVIHHRAVNDHLPINPLTRRLTGKPLFSSHTTIYPFIDFLPPSASRFPRLTGHPGWLPLFDCQYPRPGCFHNGRQPPREVD